MISWRHWRPTKRMREDVHTVVVWVIVSQPVPDWRPCRTSKQQALDEKIIWLLMLLITKLIHMHIISLYGCASTALLMFVKEIYFRMCVYEMVWLFIGNMCSIFSYVKNLISVSQHLYLFLLIMYNQWMRRIIFPAVFYVTEMYIIL